MVTRATVEVLNPDLLAPSEGLGQADFHAGRASLPTQVLHPEVVAHSISSLLRRFFSNVISAEHSCAMSRDTAQWSPIGSLEATRSSADYVCPECGLGWRRPAQ